MLRVMSQSPSLPEALENTAKPGESSKGSWHQKNKLLQSFEKIEKVFVQKNVGTIPYEKKSVHNSWIFFIKADKKKRKQIKKVTKTLDFMRVWGMLTNL